MPALSLSWDLAIILVFAIVMSFVFIVGVEKTVTIIIATYIAIIATQGVGNVLGRLLGSSDAFLVSIGMPGDTTVLPILKMFFFALCIIVFVLKSGIRLTLEHDGGTVMNIVSAALLGLALSGLVVSTVLTYAVGSAILDTSLLSNAAVLPLLQGSTLMQLVIGNQDIFFTLPAFLVITLGFLHAQNE